ncbi:DbpA RNA binding domain-containing protein, partial [Haliea sp. AH-315-K21]|nr:DbpA RNA binding domain-containing protein [Haliea sp. AH-315-K21]
AKFKQDISDTLANDDDLQFYRDILEQYQFEHNVPALDVATALAKLLRGDKPLLLKKEQKKESFRKQDKEFREHNKPRSKRRTNDERFMKSIEPGMQRYRLEVGHNHKVKPGNIVGAIANEADIESKHIGRINIFEEYSVVDLPEGMPKEILQHLKNTYVSGRKIEISEYKPEKDQGKPVKSNSKRKPRRETTKKES